VHESDTVHTSSGNVCADLEIVQPEEALTKAELARRIGGIIKHRQRPYSASISPQCQRCSAASWRAFPLIACYASCMPWMVTSRS